MDDVDQSGVDTIDPKETAVTDLEIVTETEIDLDIVALDTVDILIDIVGDRESDIIANEAAIVHPLHPNQSQNHCQSKKK